MDGVTKEPYGQNLEATLQELHTRLRATPYRPPPLRRVYIPKGQGKTRPIGISAFEDKVVPEGVREGLAAIYEQDVLACSYGFRPGRSAHAAVGTLKRHVARGEGRWRFEAERVSCCDSVDRTECKKMRAVRGAEESLWRLIGTCWHVGGRAGEAMWEPELGPVQGAVLSPWLGPVSVHYGLDCWLEPEVPPRLRGQATLLRSCDDFMRGFAREEEARRVLAVLETRLGRCGLTRHPDQTRLGPCWRPPTTQQSGPGPATFDFVGVPCYGRRTRTGHWRMGGKTRRARLRRAKQASYAGWRRQRHQPVAAQHAALRRRLRGPCNSFGGQRHLGQSAATRRSDEAGVVQVAVSS